MTNSNQTQGSWWECGHCQRRFVRKHKCRKTNIQFFIEKNGWQRVLWPGGFTPLLRAVHWRA